MAYIGRQLARGENKLFDDISSSFNGSTTTFNLTVSSVATATATPYQLFVSLGGVMQKPNTDFTTAGNQITFTTAPAAGLSCWIMMQGDTIDNAAIPDASVTPSKISGSNFAFSGDLRLKDADGSHYVGFASPTTVSTNKVWTLPAADGSASQYLQTNGSGVLTWASVTIGGATGIDFNDNVKARWGTGNDLEVFHNGSHSVINDAGTGDLLLQVGGSTKATVSSTGFDITGALTVSTNATITGNLTVSGTTTTINTQTLDVEDKNVVIGKVSSPSDTTADGGGWTLKGATDKTFNWVNATDAWTSSEHIHLIDNKKLLVGGASGTADGLEIFHDGSTSTIKDSGTGNLNFQGSHFDFINAAGNEYIARLYNDGACELYHNNVKKIETTTGGINVTGAIQVNGAALSTAPTITATASGTIAANAAVIMKSDGNVSAVTGNSTNLTSAQISNDGRSERGAILYDPDKDKYVSFYLKGASSNADCFARIGTLSGNGANAAGTISWSGEFNVTNQTCGRVFAAYDTNVNRFLLFYSGNTNGNGTLYLRQVEINSGSNGFNSGSYVNVGRSAYPGNYALSNKPDSYGRHMIVYNSGGNTYARGVKPESSINSVDMNSEVNWTSGWSNTAYAPYTVVLEEHTSPQRFIVGMNGGGSSPNMGIIGSCYHSSDSTTVFPTATRLQFENSSEVQQQWGVYDSTNDRTLLIGRKNTGGKGCIWVLRTNGDSWHTIPTEYEFTGTGDYDAIWGGTNYNNTFSGVFDPASARVHIFWSRGDKKPVRSVVEVDPSTDTISEPLPRALVFSDATEMYSQWGTYSSADSRIVWHYSKYSASQTLYSIVFQPQSTNLTTSNFIGFSSAGYTNGQTATINVVGNTTTQSSLTPGSSYYVQLAGTLATTAVTPSVLAGTALSSTKLLIKPA